MAAARGLVLLLVALAVSAAQPAAASCAQDFEATIPDAPVVFVGSVAEVRGGLARFDVQGVLKGPDLAPTIWLQGGQDQPPFPMNLSMGVGSSGDVMWTQGATYLIGASRNFRTNNCSVSSPGQVLTAADQARLRPPVDGGATGYPVRDTPIVAVIGLYGAAAVAALAVVLWATRRRRFGVSPSRVKGPS